MWIYWQSTWSPDLWIVGYYDPNGDLSPESEHDNADKAAQRVHYLNGGSEYRCDICGKHPNRG